MTLLKESARNILVQLADLVEQIHPKHYSDHLPLLTGSSIGMHTRHILEFFDCLQKGVFQSNVVDYDQRERNLQIEIDKSYTLDYIGDCIDFVDHIVGEDKELQLSFSVSEEEAKKVMIQTTLYRELAYNIEHAIHHMAIIRIAVLNTFAYIRLPEGFGIAYATIQYQQKVKA